MKLRYSICVFLLMCTVMVSLYALSFQGLKKEIRVQVAREMESQEESRRAYEEQRMEAYAESLKSTYEAVLAGAPGNVEASSGEEKETVWETYSFVYRIGELDGCVAVYEGDDLKEKTNLAVESLPPQVQEEIRAGIYLETMTEVYSCLENWTS